MELEREEERGWMEGAWEGRVGRNKGCRRRGESERERLTILTCHRYQRTEDSYIYPYKLIRLTSKFIKFRVVKVTGRNAHLLCHSM